MLNPSINGQSVFKNGPTQASFSFIFGLFKQISLQFLQQINVEKCHVHPVNGAGNRTHDLLNMSRLPWPLDQQGSRPSMAHIINALREQFMTIKNIDRSILIERAYQNFPRWIEHFGLILN